MSQIQICPQCGEVGAIGDGECLGPRKGSFAGPPGSAEHLDFLRTLPRQVLVNWISDAVADEVGITLSTFALGMQPRFKDTTPLQMFDLCAAVIREHVANRQNDRTERPGP